jgi:hypothetical protein
MTLVVFVAPEGRDPAVCTETFDSAIAGCPSTIATIAEPVVIFKNILRSGFHRHKSGFILSCTFPDIS